MPDPKMRDLTLGQFLDAVASAAPVPGGGAVAAVVGAAGSALLQMVISLALRRAKDPGTASALTSLAERTRVLQESFAGLADADVAAYRSVAEVLSLPRSTDEERISRQAKLQATLRRAAEVPLETARRSIEALHLAAEAAPLCPRVAQSDLVTAIHLLRAACASALANVDANALSLDETEFRGELARSRMEIGVAARAAAAGVLAPLERDLTGWLPVRSNRLDSPDRADWLGERDSNPH
ncbi:MAG TPA: hypothetical protein ENN53_00820 [Candidatus Acetothermia bacterium]|nr:hypothetical protein [Candidatus Acetothermia bacterium]